MKTKNQWASKLGFIMATAGAAIGLGNLWKFPYLMGRNGGASFLAVYLFFICILGIPVMMIEMSLGSVRAMTRYRPMVISIPMPVSWVCLGWRRHSSSCPITA